MGTADNWIVISTCTAKKIASPTVEARGLKPAPQAEVLKQWLMLIAGAGELHDVEQVYAGRSIGLARAAAKALAARVNIISAGLGFVRHGTQIPSYDLTISPHAQGSLVSLVQGSFDEKNWWEGIQAGRFASPLAAPDIANRRVLIALTEPYAKLIVSDLLKLAQNNYELRLFGSSLAKRLPAQLAPYVMPYDERLSSVSSGTKVDFPQRALLDYAQTIAGHRNTLDKDYDAVTQRMNAIADRPATPPHRARHSDAELLEIIRSAAPVVGRSKSKLLSHIRRQMGIACEQSRFSRLFAEAGLQHDR